MSIIRDHLLKQIAAFKAMGGSTKIDEFLVRHGKTFETGPLTYFATGLKPGRCFKNAADLAQREPRVVYVEGYVSLYGIPIHHAWVHSGDGVVIDPTLRGNTSRVEEYFGVEFSTSYLIGCLMKNRVYGLLDGFHNRKTIVDLIEGRAKNWTPDDEFLNRIKKGTP